MTELLLITDIPRLRQIFSQLSDSADIRLRVSTSLESGAKEIAAEKPAIVFVQPHLSGFSAEIMLMHLKKQLGRRRTRFVLLCGKGQVGEDVLKQYQGHVDTGLDDNQLYHAILETVNSTKHNTAGADPVPGISRADGTEEGYPSKSVQPEPPAQLQKDLAAASHPIAEPALVTQPAAETSLEEQGVVYSPRTPLSVYSEFTSSFDNAVSSMPSKGATPDSEHWAGLPDDTIDIEPAKIRPKWVTFLIWGVALFVVVIGITMLQQYLSPPKRLDIAPSATEPPPKTTEIQPPAAAEKPGASPSTAPPSPLPEAKLTVKRLTSLPEFIPRAGRDKEYSRSNPGWERYKGQRTEYKVFREGGSIKAIQVIDRGGKGLSEAFTLALLKQLVNAPVFVLEASEKKDGYEIQRGRLSEDISIVYYRDTDSSRLRAFVVTWR